VSYEVWIRKALRSREYAEEDLRSGRYDSAAFFAQQAAEFLLKGVLIKLTGSRPLTHAVSELLGYLAKALGRPVPEDVMRCAEALEAHYIQARCPDARLSEGGSGRRRRR
jgi:HEPN domain-containing protein